MQLVYRLSRDKESLGAHLAHHYLKTDVTKALDYLRAKVIGTRTEITGEADDRESLMVRLTFPLDLDFESANDEWVRALRRRSLIAEFVSEGSSP